MQLNPTMPEGNGDQKREPVFLKEGGEHFILTRAIKAGMLPTAKQPQRAAFLGLSVRTLRRIFSGQDAITPRSLSALKRSLNVSYEEISAWLVKESTKRLPTPADKEEGLSW